MQFYYDRSFHNQKRLQQLNEIAISQIKSLLANNSMKKLKQ